MQGLARSQGALHVLARCTPHLMSIRSLLKSMTGHVAYSRKQAPERSVWQASGTVNISEDEK